MPTPDERRRGPASHEAPPKPITTTARVQDLGKDGTSVRPVMSQGAMPIDDAAAIARVLDADPAELDRWRTVDDAVRRALRHLPPSADTDAARTLCAAARVEDRRRRAAVGLAEALGSSVR